MSELKNLVNKINDKWNFEIRYTEGDIEKVYRSKAEKASDAVVSFESSITVTPNAFILMNRKFVELNNV
jgi:hypothetical protein